MSREGSEKQEEPVDLAHNRFVCCHFSLADIPASLPLPTFAVSRLLLARSDFPSRECHVGILQSESLITTTTTTTTTTTII